MVVSRAGKVCYVRSFGDKDSVDPVEMGHNNIFQIASMTKIVTSVAALMLVQEGEHYYITLTIFVLGLL